MPEIIYAFWEIRNYPYLQHGIATEINGRESLVAGNTAWSWGDNTCWIRHEFTLTGDEGKTLSEQLDKLTADYNEGLLKFEMKFDRKRFKLYGKYFERD